MVTTVDQAIAKLAALRPLNPLVRGPFRMAGSGTGPLSGMPVVVKANIAVEGLPFCGASPALGDHIADRSAPVVTRLLEAGAVIVGQANMHELAFGITSHNAHYGPVGNPAAPGHMAGGSSGGTAAAVAGGAVPFGLGTDTGGSGRLPAAMCGVVGFRPTHGRYPEAGVLKLSTSFDTVTPMAADVDHIRLLDAVLAGVDLADTPDPPGPRLGIVDALWEGVDRSMIEICRARLARLEEAGATCVSLSAPQLVALCDEIAMGMVLYEAERFWTPFLAARGQTLAEFAAQIASPDVAAIFGMLADGAAPPPDAYAEMAGPKRCAICTMLEELMVPVDALVMPALPVTAPPLGATQTCAINGAETDLFKAMTARALVASVTGRPTISLPAGRLEGLPIGLEVLGRPGHDADLLALAARLETWLEE